MSLAGPGLGPLGLGPTLFAWGPAAAGFLPVAAGLAAVAVGVSLGLLGSGGSILTIPLLQSVLGLAFPVAKATSYPIVGLVAAAGLVGHARRRVVRGRALLPFVAASVPAAFVSSRFLARLVPETVQVVAFAAIMLVAAWRMAFASAPDDAARARRPLPVVLALGAATGALTGLLGVGGGFLIVPALVLTLGFEVRQAVGASLLVIVLNCAASVLANELAARVPVRWDLAAAFTAAGAAGAVVGGRLAHRLRPLVLRRVFALVVAGMALVLLLTA